jgi:hypothetical protein
MLTLPFITIVCLLDNIAVTWENAGGLEHESAECERDLPFNEDSVCNTPESRTKSSSNASHKQGTKRSVSNLVITGTWLRSWQSFICLRNAMPVLKLRVHCRVHNSSLLVAILNQTKQFPIFHHSCSRFISILTTLRSSEFSTVRLSFRYSYQIFVFISYFTLSACTTHLIIQILIL